MTDPTTETQSLVNRANIVHNFILSVFILSIFINLYMFRATM